ncbi:MAG: universal stress protein [Acidobacteriaceae bacterium]
MKMETAPFKTILVGDNGTSTAEHAVSVALFLARELNSRVIVLGVVTPPSAESQAEGYGMDDPAKARALLQEKFSVLKRTADEEGISLETTSLTAIRKRTSRRSQIGSPSISSWWVIEM